MAKDPAFLFYPGDWLGGTMGMTFEQKGAYIDLLMLQFNRGHMTSHMIGQTVGQIWDGIKDKFIKDDKGCWYNERLDVEKTKRKDFTTSRLNNKNGKNQYTKKRGHMTSHMENVNINENKDINTDENTNYLVPEMFKTFKKIVTTYLGSIERDFKPLYSIAQFLNEQGKGEGTPDRNADQVLQAWKAICLVIKEDNFWSQKSLNSISTHIQEITNIALNGKKSGHSKNPIKPTADDIKEAHTRRFAGRG